MLAAILAIAVFWVVVILGRMELGWCGLILAFAVWVPILIGILFAGEWRGLFIVFHTLLDIALLLFVFRRDFPLMP